MERINSFDNKTKTMNCVIEILCRRTLRYAVNMHATSDKTLGIPTRHCCQ